MLIKAFLEQFKIECISSRSSEDEAGKEAEADDAVASSMQAEATAGLGDTGKLKLL